MNFENEQFTAEQTLTNDDFEQIVDSDLSHLEIKISEKQQDPEWDNFVVSNLYCQHEQTSGFASTRMHIYGMFRILLFNGNQIIGGSQILYLPTPFGNVAEIRHGPIFIENSAKLINKFFNALEDEIKKETLSKLK